MPPLFGLEDYQFEPWQHNKAARFHPLGVMYLAGYLRRHCPDIEFSIFDANVELPLYYRHHPELIGSDVDGREVLQTVFREYLSALKPEVIGISGPFHSVLRSFHFLAQTAKDHMPGSHIISGGPYPTGSPDMVLRDPAIDYVVKGEAEFRSLDLLRYFQGQMELESLDGIIYRDEAGSLHETRSVGMSGVERELSLDDIPHPARDLLRQDEYTGVSSERSSDYLWREDYRTTAIYATRGCPMRCSYCNSGTSNYYGRRFRWQSVENVINEIQYCIDHHDIQEIQFYDENVTAHQKYAYELFRALNELPVNWTFVTLELEKLEERSLVEYKRKKQCSWFSVGMESGNNRVLKEIAWRKASRTTMIDQMEVLRTVVGVECFVNGSFILGFPGEKVGEMLDTVEFAKIVGIDWAAFFCYMPLPGTPLHELCVREGYLNEAEVDYAKIRPENSVLNTPDWTAEEVTLIRNWANYEVNFVSNRNIADHPEKAIQGFEYVLTVAPDHFFAFYALGECYLKLGDGEKAEGCFARAVQVASREPYKGYLDHFDLPHIGRSRRRDIVPHH